MTDEEHETLIEIADQWDGVGLRYLDSDAVKGLLKLGYVEIRHGSAHVTTAGAARLDELND